MNFGFIIFALIIVFLLFYIISTYNRGIALKNYVLEAFATMDVYLKKRWDLIPNLVETVKGYSKFEQKTLSDVTELRTKNYSSMNASEKIETNSLLGKAITNLIAVAENYPDLKANINYQNLMNELAGIEEDIANSRKYYNGTVREMNLFLDQFPTNIIGKIFNMQKADMFEISNDERQNVKVKF